MELPFMGIGGQELLLVFFALVIPAFFSYSPYGQYSKNLAKIPG